MFSSKLTLLSLLWWAPTQPKDCLGELLKGHSDTADEVHVSELPYCSLWVSLGAFGLCRTGIERLMAYLVFSCGTWHCPSGILLS